MFPLRLPLLFARSLASISLAALMAGCSVAGAPEPSPESSSFPTFEDFRARVYQDAEGRFIVDGDIPIYSERGLREFYQAALSAHEDRVAAQEGLAVSRDHLLVNTFSGADDLQPLSGRFDMTYCVSSSFGADLNTVIDGLERAARSWSDILGVRHRRVDVSPCDASSAVTFNVRPMPPGSTTYATSFFPSYSRSTRELLIDDSAFTATLGGRDFEGILRHELGHTLGFRHEHIVLDPQCTFEDAVEFRAVTEYDVDSVMHYPQCRPSGTGGYRQSYHDYQGGNLLYGLAPALTSAVL
ncbi:hypothetical protein [Sorangium sp. So ce1151]|uniref:hypothetical protein n=1 Tax=Sorangium sp. So ce1151 TaxID=3133332 RepID=UPI003F63CB34